MREVIDTLKIVNESLDQAIEAANAGDEQLMRALLADALASISALDDKTPEKLVWNS